MTVTLNDENRVVVPRWREVASFAPDSECLPVSGERQPGEVDPAELLTKIEDWRRYRSTPFATEAVASAVSLGLQELVGDIAEQVIAASDATPEALMLARRALGEYDNVSLYLPQPLSAQSLAEKMRQARGRLRDDPRNALLWSRVSRLYASMGKHRKAKEAMRVALGLYPSHRSLLRRASRLSLEIEEPDWGRSLLLKSVRVRTDPWLMAAEIALATSMNLTSPLLVAGRKMLSSGAMRPTHITELASAVATVEYQAGSVKLGRRFLRQSLRDPTDNSVAQAQDLMKCDSSIEISSNLLALPFGFEARAAYSLEEGEWLEAKRQSTLWQADEPFSERAAVMGSFVSSVALGDDSGALQFLDVGLLAKPDDWILLNNKAFALASLGRLAEAKEAVRRAFPSAPAIDASITLAATRGLIDFRSGNSESGRGNYQAAIESAVNAKRWLSAALAAAFLAREEILAGTGLDANALGQFERLVPKVSAGDALILRALESHFESMMAPTDASGAGSRLTLTV